MRMSAYLDLQWQMRYHEAGSVNNEYVHILVCMSRNKMNQTRMANKSTKQSISHEIIYVGPPPKPVCFAWINFINSIIWNYEIKFQLVFKTFRKSDEVTKICMPKEKWRQNFIWMGFLKPKKNTKDGEIRWFEIILKQLEIAKLFGNKYGLEKLLTKLGFGKIMLLKSNEKKKWSND